MASSLLVQAQPSKIGRMRQRKVQMCSCPDRPNSIFANPVIIRCHLLSLAVLHKSADMSSLFPCSEASTSIRQSEQASHWRLFDLFQATHPPPELKEGRSAMTEGSAPKRTSCCDLKFAVWWLGCSHQICSRSSVAKPTRRYISRSTAEVLRISRLTFQYL